jgi:transcriptional regulator with XRE-family HTH domain
MSLHAMFYRPDDPRHVSPDGDLHYLTFPIRPLVGDRSAEPGLRKVLKSWRQRVDRNVETLGPFPRWAARIGKPVTQEEMADTLEVSRQWYAMLEAGVARTSAALLDRISSALSLTPRERMQLFRLALPEFRKTKEELIEIITLWAALESMAARLVTERATDEEIASLRGIFSTFKGAKVSAMLDEYSDANLRFHQRIIDLSHSAVFLKMADELLIHIRSIRDRAISEDRRFERSMVDHMHIIDALEARESDLAERLVRDHALSLADHVAQHVEDF